MKASPLRTAHAGRMLSAALLLTAFLSALSALADKDPATTGAQPALSAAQVTFFESKIRPLLVTNCYACHSDQAQRGGLRLDSREAMLKGNAAGPVLIPGDADKSRLILAVRYDGKVKMPPAGKLRPEEIAALTEWVKMGAPWPTEKPAQGAAPANPNGDYEITPTQRNFWSFRPIKKPALPAVKNAAWVKSPIDRFILARLEARGLKPAPPADRRTLIRRAYFDLIGLPPTPQEVDAFVKDPAPNAFATVVDHLLASPQYGERWGRHWLDVVRYADSNGLDENVAFANAFRYRDYVVAAFNKDKPYDQFVTEQLAGDLLPIQNEPQRNECLLATGFLTLGPKVLAEPDKEKMVMDIIDEQIDVTSKAFLGLTVACARCHNHKFDPIPTKDYYALAGIFKSTRSMASLSTVAMWEERPLETPELRAQRKEYAQKIQGLQGALMAVTEKAKSSLLASYRRDAGRYLLAGWDLVKHPPVDLGSVAELPARPGEQRILVEAEDFVRGNVNRDTTNFGKGIGVIHNIGLPDFAEWEITVPTAGVYQIEMRYASGEERPTRLLLNGKVIRTDAAGKITGSFFPEGQRWEAEGVFPFQAGKNVLRIERDEPIPHFDKILIVSTPPSAQGAQSVEEVAAQRHLNPEVLRRCALNLRGLAKNGVLQSLPDPVTLSEADFDTEAARLTQRIEGASDADATALRAEIARKD